MKSVSARITCGLAAVAIGGAGVLAVALLDGSAMAAAGTTTGHDQAPSIAGPAMSSVAQAKLFPVLAQPPTIADSTLEGPAKKVAESAQESEVEARPEDVRVVEASTSLTVGIMPSRTGMCILAVEAGGGVSSACSPAETVSNVGLVMGFQNEEGHHVVGVVPSGAHGVRIASNSSLAAPVTVTSDDAYAYVNVTAPNALTFTGTDGRAVDLALPSSRSPQLAK